MNRILETLGSCVLFEGIGEEGLSLIIEAVGTHLASYAKADHIMRCDEGYPCVSVIIDGEVDIMKPMLNGNSLCLGIRGKGGVFGGAVVFADKDCPCGCDVTARRRLTLWNIPKNTFSRLLLDYPRLRDNLNRLYGMRILDLQQRMELLSYTSIREKIAYYCRYVLKPDSGGIFRLPLPKAKWAEYMNISRPSLMRELKTLEEEGTLRISLDRSMTFEPEDMDRLLYC